MFTLFALLLVQEPAAQDGPAPITAPIVSWYRFDRKEREDGDERWIHHGFAREKLTPVGGKSWAYDYTWEFVFIMPQGETKLSSGRLLIEAQLDAHFDAVQMDGSIKVVDGDSRQFALRTEGDRRVLTITCSDRILKVLKSIDDPATPLAPLMLMAAWRTGNLKDGTPLRFIDPWVEKPLVEVVPAVAKPVKRELLGQNATVIDVSLKGLPPMMPEIPAFPTVTMDRYGRFVAAASEDGTLRLSLVADEENAVKGDAMLQKARRDPFAKPAAKSLPTIEVTLQASARVADADSSFDRAKTLAGSIRDHVLAQDREKAERDYLAFLAIYRVLWDRLDSIKQAKLEKMRIDAEASFGGVAQLLRRAEAIVATMNDYVDALQVAKAQEYLKILETLEKHDAFYRREEQKQIQKFAREGAAVVERGRTLVELHGKKLVLTGTAVTGDPKTTFAVINDNNVRVGETVAGVKVESITRDLVVVSLNGVKREIALKKD